MIIATSASLPAWLVNELRTDHAGETGAVEIYNGILALSSDADVISFARRHRETEARHLEEISAILAPPKRSVFLPVWRALGWITGALPALIGPAAVFATIEAVETFVDRHYQTQVDRLRREDGDPTLIELLDRLRRDEVEHLHDARARARSKPGAAMRLWLWLVARGSEAAVSVARMI
jgi:ubiquinone biosynthesis monooxygenase Coq7